MPMPVFGAGMRLPASYLEQMARQIDSLTAPGWITYTPAWTTSGGAPSLGNGTLTGRYRRPAGSDLIHVEIRLMMGSTTAFGTGTYFMSVPVAPSATAVLNGNGPSYFLDAGTLDKAGGVKFEDSTKFTFVTATVGVVTNTIPHTWAINDILRGTILYEAA